MGNVIPILGGGGGAGSDDCTATKDKVLSGYTAVTRDSDDEPVAGTMENLTVKTNIQHDSNNGTKVIKADGAFLGNNTDGVRRLSLRYNGNAGYITPNTLFGLPAQTKTVASSTSNQTVTADSGKVLESVTVSGMPYRGGLAKAESQWFGNGNVYFGITAGAYTSAAPGDNKPQVYRTAAELGIEQWKIRGDASICGIAGDGWTVWTGGVSADDSKVRSGYTYWREGTKRVGTLSIQSAISFSAAALSDSSVRISWKNPAKGPWQGVFIQMSTSGYPGTGGGSRVYTGAGTNPNQAGGNNYIDIGGLNPSSTYYFTCTSYNDALGWGASHNVSVRTNYVDLRNVFNKPGSKYVVYYVRDSYESGGESYYNRIHFRSDYGVSANMISWSIGGSIDRTWGSWSRGSRMRFYFKYSADIQPSNDLIAALNKYKNVTWVARRDKWSQTTYEVPIQSFSWIKMGGGGLNNSGYWIILDLEKDADTVLSDIRENEITFKP